MRRHTPDVEVVGTLEGAPRAAPLSPRAGKGAGDRGCNNQEGYHGRWRHSAAVGVGSTASEHGGNIQITLSNRGTPDCETSNSSTPRTIDCDINLALTEYVIVHELGHAFNNQSDQRLGDPITGTETTSLLERMDSGLVVEDCVGNRVLGEVPEDESTWSRGERGWGSGPGKNASGGRLFTTFQQNPKFQPTYLKVEAVDEAVADMFLNWVYRIQYRLPSSDPCNDPVPGTWQGFLNKSWLGISSSIPTAGTDDSTRPGSKRYAWMHEQMQSIFTEHGW